MSIMDSVLDKEWIRSLLTEGKSFHEIMTAIMKEGAKITDEVGHAEFATAEEFFEALKNNATPLNKIDGDIVTHFEGAGTNLIGVKECPMRKIMEEMAASGTNDAKVATVMDGFHLREGEDADYPDLGCYIMQQIRQMVISSIKINGKYDLNFIPLGCDKGTGKRTIYKGDVDATNIDLDLLNRMLDQFDCVYAISYKEGQEE